MTITSGSYLKGLRFASILFIIILFSGSQLKAQGDLQLMPKRVTFEGGTMIEEVNVINVGKETATYNISLIQNRMKENGAFEKITEPDSGQYFADENLRFFPRSVTLEPNEAQVVKIQAIRTSNLAPGEYRSHLYFRAVPDSSPLGEKEGKSVTSGSDNKGISIELIPVFGITIPIIIRVGESTAQVNISDLHFSAEKEHINLSLKFNRSGNMSVYGDLIVNHISTQGMKTEVGFVKGIAVYTPNSTRYFEIALKQHPDVNYHEGKLHLSYKAQNGDKASLAESELLLVP